MSTRAVIYRRVSTDEQGASGAGLAAQLVAVERELEARGWQAVAVSTDVASGASMRKRRGLAEALELLAAGGADVLVCSKLDRLSRSTLDFAALLERAKREGWRVLVLDVAVDTGTAAGELTATMVAAAAQYERRLIGERTRAALAVRKAQGATLGRPRRIDLEQDALVWQLYVEQGLSLRQVCAALEAAAVLTPAGGSRWYPATVRRMVMRKGAVAA